MKKSFLVFVALILSCNLICAKDHGVEMGSWHGRDFSTEWQSYSWTLSEPVDWGTNQLEFKFETGTNYFQIKNVQIIVDGEIILSDTTEQSLWYKAMSACYEFAIPSASNDVVVKAMCRKDTPADSKGIIYVKNKRTGCVRTVKAGGSKWNVGDFATSWDYYAYDFSEYLSDDTLRDYSLIFKYSSGGKALCARNVEIYADDELIGTFPEKRSAGSSPKSFEYVVNVKPGTKKLLLAGEFMNDGGTNSIGNIRCTHSSIKDENAMWSPDIAIKYDTLYWKKGEFTTSWESHTYDLSQYLPIQSSLFRVLFKYKSGSHKLCAKNVKIYADDQLIGDYPDEVEAGNSPKEFSYTFNVQPGISRLTLVGDFMTHGGNNSNGEIEIRNYTGKDSLEAWRSDYTKTEETLVFPKRTATQFLWTEQDMGENAKRILCNSDTPDDLKKYHFNVARPMTLDAEDGVLYMTSFMLYPCANVQVLKYQPDGTTVTVAQYDTIMPLTKYKVLEGVTSTRDYSVKSDDEFYVCLNNLRVEWNCSFSGQTENAHALIMTAPHCREWIAMITEFAYAFSSKTCEHFLINSKNRFYTNNGEKYITPDELLALYKRAMSHSFTLGALDYRQYYEFAGLGAVGGGTLWLVEYYFHQHYTASDWVSPMAHEFMHNMGYNHDSNMCGQDNHFQFSMINVLSSLHKKYGVPYRDQQILNTEELWEPDYFWGKRPKVFDDEAGTLKTTYKEYWSSDSLPLEYEERTWDLSDFAAVGPNLFQFKLTDGKGGLYIKDMEIMAGDSVVFSYLEERCSNKDATPEYFFELSQKPENLIARAKVKTDGSKSSNGYVRFVCIPEYKEYYAARVATWNSDSFKSEYNDYTWDFSRKHIHIGDNTLEFKHQKSNNAVFKDIELWADSTLVVSDTAEVVVGSTARYDFNLAVRPKSLILKAKVKYESSKSTFGDIRLVNHPTGQDNPDKPEEPESTILVVPEGTLIIDYNKYRDREDITEAYLPSTLRLADKYCFDNCKNLEKVVFADNGNLELDNWCFAVCYKLKDVKLNEGLIKINEHAFYACKSIEELTIPRSVQYISSNNSIPKTVKLKVYKDTYALVFALKNGYEYEIIDDDNDPDSPIHEFMAVTVTEPGTLSDVLAYSTRRVAITGPLNEKDLAYLHMMSNKEILISIDLSNAELALEGGTEYEEYKDEKGNNTSDYLLAYCKNLKTVILPAFMTQIETRIFSHAGLVSVVIPDSVTTIGADAFSYCYSMKWAVIGKGVTSMGQGVFYKSGLEDVYVKALVPPALKKSEFTTKPTIHVYKESLDAYLASSWASYGNIVGDLDHYEFGDDAPVYTNVEKVEGLQVFTDDNVIVVRNAGAQVSVYDAAGRLVARKKADGNLTEIPVKGSGIYMVKCGDRVLRVLIRQDR